MFAAFIFALKITLPNILLMVLGFVMQQRQAVNQNFIETASDMVFNYCLPCLLFFSILKSDINFAAQLTLIQAGLIVTLSLFFGAEIFARFFIKQRQDKGVFVQGVFRSNMAIMGLATVTNAYGGSGMGVGAVYMGTLTIVYNILSVITLSQNHHTAQHDSVLTKTLQLTKKIGQNPLIIALVAAFLYKMLALPMLPEFIVKTGELLAAVALPLALICAGATLDIKSMMRISGVSMQASVGRIVVAPIVAIVVGLLMQLSPLQMGVMFVMVASPVAAASYVMARSMGGNEVLAANILGFTTVFSMFSLALGMALLRHFGLA